MAKSDQKREEIAQRIAATVVSRCQLDMGVRDMAAAAGLSDRMLLYYFPDKEAVVSAVLDVIAAGITEVLKARTPTRAVTYDALKHSLSTLVEAPDAQPYLVAWQGISGHAAQGAEPFRHAAERIDRAALVWIASQLDSRERGRESARLLAVLRGAMALRVSGLEDVAAAALE